MPHYRRSPSRRLPCAAAIVLAAVFALPVTADHHEGPATRSERPAAAAPAEKEPKCVHGCQRWGEFCNVDPRGVYKCQRRCEKFGEICE